MACQRYFIRTKMSNSASMLYDFIKVKPEDIKNINDYGEIFATLNLTEKHKIKCKKKDNDYIQISDLRFIIKN